VGRSFLLARADLEAFLDRIHEGASPASLLSPRPEPVPRRGLREFVQVDHVPATLDEAPGNVSLQPGVLAISFGSMEELAGALLATAEILDNAEQFAAVEDRYAPRPRQPNPRPIRPCNRENCGKNDISRVLSSSPTTPGRASFRKGCHHCRCHCPKSLCRTCCPERQRSPPDRGMRRRRQSCAGRFQSRRRGHPLTS
jgi:hypothetical protein